MNNISNIFNSISKNLNDNEKKLGELSLTFPENNNLTEAESTLKDNSFADLTFYSIYINNTKRIRISLNAFGKAAKTIRIFLCVRDARGNACSLQNQPPKYDIWSSLRQLTHVKYIGVGLNVSEMPSNAFGLNPNQNYQIQLQKL